MDTNQLVKLARGTEKQLAWSLNMQIVIIMVSDSRKKYKIVIDSATR
jgi:uncharacterized protein YaeQ